MPPRREGPIIRRTPVARRTRRRRNRASSRGAPVSGPGMGRGVSRRGRRAQRTPGYKPQTPTGRYRPNRSLARTQRQQARRIEAAVRSAALRSIREAQADDDGGLFSSWKDDPGEKLSDAARLATEPSISLPTRGKDSSYFQKKVSPLDIASAVPGPGTALKGGGLLVKLAKVGAKGLSAREAQKVAALTKAAGRIRAEEAAKAAARAAKAERTAAQAGRRAKRKPGRATEKREPTPIPRRRKAARAIKKVPSRTKAKAKRGASVARHPTTPLASTRWGAIAVPGGAKAGALAASGVGTSVPIVTSVVEGGQRTVRAAADNPPKTAATTGRVALGIPAAVLGIAADAAASAKSGSLDPLKGQLKQQERYLRQYGKLVHGTEEQAKKVVQEELGLVPALSAGLTAGALVKAGRAARPKVPKTARPDRQTRRLKKEAENASSRADRQAARQALEEGQTKEPLRARHGHRKREAERASVREQKARAHGHREQRKRGKRKVTGRRESHTEQLGRLTRTAVNETVSRGDVVHYLARHGYTAETRDVLGKVARNREAHVEPKKALPADTVHTREVEDAILAHPEILRDPDVARAVQSQLDIQRGRAIERHEQRTGESKGTPEPKDEPATFLPMMRAEGVLLGRERIPHELRGKTKVQPRSGTDATKAIRGSGKSLLSKARRLRATAATLRERGKPGGMYAKRAATLEKRAAQYEARAEELLAVTDRFKRAEVLDRKAAKVEAEGGDPIPLREQAEELRVAGEKAQARTHAEAMGEVRRVIQRERLQEPGFVHQVDVAEGRSASVPQQFPGAKTPRKEQFRSGSLERQGRIDESAQTLVENTHRERITLVHHETAKGFLDEQTFKAGGSRFFTSSELRRLRAEGKVPPGYKDVPAQEFAGTIQRNDALRREHTEARYRADVGRHKGGEQRKLYVAVPSSAIQQYRAQLGPIEGLLKGVRAVSRAQTGAMLGTSPTWFAFQIPATPMGILARNWSPARYARAARATRDVWRNTPERTRIDFEAHFGANSGDLLRIGDSHTAITPNTVRSMNRGLRFAFRSPVGRFLHDVGESLRRGGPLIGLNRRYEAKLRTFAAMMEADRMEGLTFKGNPTASARVHSFIQSLARTTDAIAAHQDAAAKRMRGMKPHERIEVYLEESPLMRDLENRVNDTLGEWGALTDFERKLGSVVIFYPFVRYSLRWMLYAFPKNNPLKAAVLYNLAQSNNVELQRVLHGTPDFFQTWGTVVTHTGEDGAAKTGINVARFAPGGNAIIEAIGSGKLDLSTLVRPLQPVIGTALTALEGKTPFGDPASEGTTQGHLFLKGLAGLSPVTRPLQRKIGPEPSDISKLFRAILEQPEGLEGTLVPKVTKDLRRERTAQRLSELLDIAFGPGPDSPGDARTLPIKEQAAGRRAAERKQKAWDEINAMMRAYGIASAAEQKANKQTYDKRSGAFTEKYGIFGTEKPKKSSGRSSYDSVFGGGGSPRPSGGSSSGGGSSSYQRVFGN